MPETEEQRETRLARLDEHRRELPNLRHGMRTRGLYLCKACHERETCDLAGENDGACERERAYMEERLRELATAPGVELRDQVQARKAVWLEILQERGLRHLALLPDGGIKSGRDGVRFHPLFDQLLSAMRVHDTVLTNLAASPAARARLKLDAQGAADPWREAIDAAAAAEERGETAD